MEKIKNGNYLAINWNAIEDQVDLMTFNKLNSQFWLDTRIPVSNDLDDWRLLSQAEKDLIGKVFGGLTLLDTMQSQDGVEVIRNDARTPQEVAVLNNIQFMESIHAKSYSTIFTTLNTTKEIDDIFEWTNSNETLQYKAKVINDIYMNGNELQKKAASVMLETFLFYSGFFTPLYFLGLNKMLSVAEIIKLIIRDESVHGTYIGYKHQLAYNNLSEEEKEEHKNWVLNTFFDLFMNETKYVEELYKEVGWEKEVLTFLEYNGNKALQNLGFEPVFPTNHTDVNPLIINGLSATASNHDFFSQVGNSYTMGLVEGMKKEDYDISNISNHKNK